MSNAPPKVVRDLLPTPPARWTYVEIPPGTDAPVTARCTHQGVGSPLVVTLLLYRLTRGSTAFLCWVGVCEVCGNGIWALTPTTDQP